MKTNEKADEVSVESVEAFGALAIGGRLRRLSDRIDREAKAIYESMGLEFEQRWFPVFNCLRSDDALSVTGISERLGISHVSVSVTRKSLENAQLVTSRPDNSDGRRTVLTLTDKGKALSKEFEPLFQALDQAAAELNDDAGNAMSSIKKLEDALNERSLSARVERFLKRGQAR